MGIGGRLALGPRLVAADLVLQRSRRWGSAEGCCRSARSARRAGSFNGAADGDRRKVNQTVRKSALQMQASTEPPMGIGGRAVGLAGAAREDLASTEPPMGIGGRSAIVVIVCGVGERLQRSRRWGSAEGVGHRLAGHRAVPASTEPPMGIGGRLASRTSMRCSTAALQRSRRWGSAEGRRARPEG